MIIVTKTAGSFDPTKELNIKKLKQGKAELMGQAEQILNAAEGLGMDGKRQAEYSGVLALLDAVNAGIQRIEAAQEAQRAQGPAQVVEFRDGQWVDTTQSHRAKRTPSGAVSDRTFAGMFGAPLGSAWRDGNEFLAAIHSGRFDERFKATMTGGLDPRGGYAVPEELSSQWLNTALEDEIVRPRAQVWPMTSDTRKIPGFDAADHSENLFGGLFASWSPEAANNTEVDAKLRLVGFTANKLACFTRVSNELLEDGLSFEQQLNAAMSKCISWYLDYAFLRGTGAGMPLGILNDPSRITVPKESGQVGTILYLNLVKMFARMHPACIQNSIWVANNTAIPQLLTLYQEAGETGVPVPVLQQSNGKYTLLTRPCLFTEKLPALGTEGDIALVDLSQYAIGMRREATLDKSQHVGWLTDTVGYRAILRVDGRGVWNAAITPKEGDSLSWCVTLADR